MTRQQFYLWLRNSPTTENLLHPPLERGGQGGFRGASRCPSTLGNFYRWFVSLYIGLTLAVTAIGFSPISNILARGLSIPDDIVPSDCIVVLGGGVMREGDLSTTSLERMVSGAILYRKGLAPKIILSTGVSGKRPPYFSEAKVMKKTLLDLGVPEDAIVLEENSTRTAENASETTQMMKKLGYQNALLVTSTTHMRRSLLSFKKYGADVHPAPVPSALENDRSFTGRIKLFQAVCHEYAGIFYYRVRGWL